MAPAWGALSRTRYRDAVRPDVEAVGFGRGERVAQAERNAFAGCASPVPYLEVEAACGEFFGEVVGLGRERGGGVNGVPLGEGVRGGGGERRLLRARNDTYVASGLGHQRRAGQPEADEHEEHEFSHHRFIQTLFRGVKLRKTI